MADIDLQTSRSEEVQDIIDRMPTGWTYRVGLVVISLLSVLLGISFLVSYPDTVDGEVTLTSSVAPVRLVASTSGRLHLLQSVGTKLVQGDVIGYIESGLDYSSFLYLEQVLGLGIVQDSLPAFERNLELGELGNSYNLYIQAYDAWWRLRTSPKYATIRKALEDQISSSIKLSEHIQLALRMQSQVIASTEDLLHRDSLLLSKAYVAEYDYRQSENNLLSIKGAYANARSAYLAKLSEIQQGRMQVLRNAIEEEEMLKEVYSNLEAKYQTLINDVRLWRERYLFVAPIDGKLDYLGFWQENAPVQSGMEVFSVVPPTRKIIGEAIIPAIGAGKVKVGMDVHIKLQDYPYDEYGLIRGQVESISILTHKVTTTSGEVSAYRIRISLPEGLCTNFGQVLQIGPESKGIAEIITKPRRLIERLFDNLKAKSTK